MTKLEKLIEIKFALNHLIASRHKYKLDETSEIRLADNTRYLEYDYEILKEILELIEVEKNES